MAPASDHRHDLHGDDSVKFNGAAADFTVNSDTQITATVPAGATTGPISVTTPAGTATSATDFFVSPGTIGVDATVFMDGSGTMTTPPFSTSTAGDLLIAFVAYDGPSTPPQTASVSGAGLTWTLVQAQQFSGRHGGDLVRDGHGLSVRRNGHFAAGNRHHLPWVTHRDRVYQRSALASRPGWRPSGAPDFPFPACRPGAGSLLSPTTGTTRSPEPGQRAGARPSAG